MNILTGLQANTALHIGNYFGSLLPMAERQKKLQHGDELYLMVADLHSYTMSIDHDVFYQTVQNNIRWFIAAGVDPQLDGTSLFRQSHVPAHSELAWHLSCFSYFGELSRMTQFKDKSSRSEELGNPISVGLFTYPILMAADILLYDAQYVPIGDDQKQHLELTRDLAIRFNNKFESRSPEGVFVVPEDWKAQLEYMELEEGVRIRSLSKPEKKMSKSSRDEKSKIMLDDDPKVAAKKIMSATTDNVGVINWDWKNQPGITNLLQMAYLMSDVSKQEVINEWTGKERYGDLKKHVAALVEEFLTRIQKRFNGLSDSEIENVLRIGEHNANIKSQEVLKRTRVALGLEK